MIQRFRRLPRNTKIVIYIGSGLIIFLLLFFFLRTTRSTQEQKNKPCILIFGGAGYIGSHVVLELLRKKKNSKNSNNFDYRIAVFDDLSEGHKTSLNRVQKLTGQKIDFMQGDINSEEDVNRAFNKYEPIIVFHLCAKIEVGESVKDPLKYYYNNIAGTINILREMQAHETLNFVFSSTAAVFGNPDPKNIPITYDSETKPINPYGFTKLAIERLMVDSREAWGLKFVGLRYFNAAGADESGEIGEAHRHESHLIPLVLDVPLGKREKIFIFGDDYDETEDGTCVRDYIHVSDIAQAHIDSLLFLLDNKNKNKNKNKNNENNNKGVFVNLGNGRGYSVKEVIDTCEKVTGQKIKVEITKRRDGDPPILIASSKHAEKILGWKRKYKTIEEIIKSAWKWHENNPNGY